MSSAVERLCANPSCDKKGVHLCSGCGEEIYCSKECQKGHWSIHKPLCQQAGSAKDAAKSKSFDTLSVKQLKNVVKAKASSMDDSKRARVLEELERISEKPDLVRFVSRYVKPGEVDKLLSTPAIAATKAKVEEKKKTKEALKGLFPTPTPDQLLQQASMMRSNPAMVRQANPAFAAMSDEQIKQYADQLEKAASDPAMMKEIEKMSQMSPSQRDSMQQIQEGLAGVKPMDDAWVDSTINTLKTNPGLFKAMLKGQGQMMGGVSDDQVNAFIDMAASTPAYILKFLVNVIRFIGTSAKPVMAVYKVLDTYTLGLIKYVLMAAVAYLLYYWAVLSLFVMRWLYAKVIVLIYGTTAAAGAAAATTSTATATASSSAANSAATLAAQFASSAAASAAVDEFASEAVNGVAAAAATAATTAATAAAATAAAGEVARGAVEATVNAATGAADYDF